MSTFSEVVVQLDVFYGRLQVALEGVARAFAELGRRLLLVTPRLTPRLFEVLHVGEPRPYKVKRGRGQRRNRRRRR